MCLGEKKGKVMTKSQPNNPTPTSVFKHIPAPFHLAVVTMAPEEWHYRQRANKGSPVKPGSIWASLTGETCLHLSLAAFLALSKKPTGNKLNLGSTEHL